MRERIEPVGIPSVHGGEDVNLLAGVMASIALLLACTGIYAVTRHSVVQRTGELGIRTALAPNRVSSLGWFSAKACFRSHWASRVDLFCLFC